MSEPEVNEVVVQQFEQMLAAAQQGKIVGHVSVLFNADGQLNIMVAGDQSLIQRLGVLEVAKDGVKAFAFQQEQQQKQHLATMPAGGRA